MEVYVQKDGLQLGPFSEDRIRQGIDAGEFDPADLAWILGKVSWQPLSTLIDLDITKPPPISPSNQLDALPVSTNTAAQPEADSSEVDARRQPEQPFQAAKGTNGCLHSLGCLMTIGSIAVIVICWVSHFFNKREAAEHPLETLFSGGANLSKAGYTFLPPWTGFELFILALLVAGFALAVLTND